MSHFERLALTFIIIFVSLAAGYICKGIVVKKNPAAEETSLKSLRKILQTIAIYGLLPFSAMLSLWGLAKPDSDLLILPLLGLFSYIWGGLLALLVARLLKMPRKQTGSFYCCGTFTNISAVGGLVCLLFLGENSIALVALYRLVEDAYYFSVTFPIAKYYSQENAALKLRNLTFSPIIAIIVCALGLGIALNYMNVSRPAAFGPVASVSMLLATVFLLFAIGLSLRISKMFAYIRPGLWMCAIKFVGIPVVIVAIAKILGLGAFDNGLALKTVVILSSMPIAMTALVPPSLFDLDVDLANSCWLITTIGLIAVLPALVFILPLI